MDYHFYESPKPQPRKQKSLPQIFLYFVPLFFVAALLPILLGLVKKPVQTTFRADASENELLLWLEPANVSMSVGRSVKLSVIGMFDSDGKFLPGVNIPLMFPEGIEASLNSVTYRKAFTGQVKLGEITVTPKSEGTYEISIDKNGVVSETYPENLPVSASSSILVVH